VPRIILPFALLTTTLALALPAHAGTLTRTFVSAAGLDTNPCTVTQPCRTFAAAYAATAANGIVSVLDPAGYGSLTITGPITIDGNGWAAITAPNGGSGITVSAGANDFVHLRGLTVDSGGGPNTTGITFFSGSALIIDDCVVRNMLFEGLDFRSNASTMQTLAVSNSHFNGNGGRGISISTMSSGTITASIDKTEFANNTVGLVASGTGGTGLIDVAVTDSVAANNAGTGFVVQSNGAHSATNLTLTRSQAAGNTVGVLSTGANATLWLAQSTIAGNGTGFNAAGTINTYGDNYINDNLLNTGSLSSAGKQ
jgi:hypothetical protein